MFKSQILCDRCNKDLKSTDYAYEYRLRLSAEAKINNSGFSYAMGLNADIKEDMHFCGLLCLKQWINNAVTE